MNIHLQLSPAPNVLFTACASPRIYLSTPWNSWDIIAKEHTNHYSSTRLLFKPAWTKLYIRACILAIIKRCSSQSACKIFRGRELCFRFNEVCISLVQESLSNVPTRRPDSCVTSLLAEDVKSKCWWTLVMLQRRLLPVHCCSRDRLVVLTLIFLQSAVV